MKPLGGMIELTLPISVQTAAKSYSHSGKKRKEDGSRVLVVELTAYQSSYTIKPEENLSFCSCYCLNSYLYVYFLNKNVGANFVKTILNLSTTAPSNYMCILLLYLRLLN